MIHFNKELLSISISLIDFFSYPNGYFRANARKIKTKIIQKKNNYSQRIEKSRTEEERIEQR
jgi:hypothetical protein